MSTARLQQLEDKTLSGPFRLPQGTEADVTEAANALGWPLVCYRPEAAADTSAWLTGLGEALGFPDHFGANFDALYDCLTELEPGPAQGHILILGNLAPLGEEVDILIAVLQAASDEWREQDRALWALLDAPRLDLDPLPKA